MARVIDTPLGWLRACIRDPANPVHDKVRLTRDRLGALTGQDARALTAIGACFDLYAASDERGRHAALSAAAALVLDGMQPSCRLLARELVARSLNWSDRDPVAAKINALAGLPLL